MNHHFHKKIFAAAGYTTEFFGSGSKEFNPKKPFRTFDSYLKETAEGTMAKIPYPEWDEGFLGSFMPGKFINQGNLPGFLPFMIESLKHKPCTGIEGACGTGGRVIGQGIRSLLSGLAQQVFAAAFEIQNTMKALYGADVLAGASYYQKERKSGEAFFFPGVFSQRVEAYMKIFDKNMTRESMAKWYELAIFHARYYPKAQEFTNQNKDLFSYGMIPPNKELFVPFLNAADCSKVSDGAASIGLFSEEGLKKAGIEKKDALEIIGLGEAEDDITKPPLDLTEFTTTKEAVKKALLQSNITLNDLSYLEVHDCFSISAIQSLEACGFAKKGEAPSFILEGQTDKQGKIPTNLSGGLIGFGHPTGASGIRQMVDLIEQLTGKAQNQAPCPTPFGMMISMGGNDKTVTCIIVKRADA